jgi:uncharacterized protein DUF1570
MTKQTLMTNDERWRHYPIDALGDFIVRVSSFFRHSRSLIRHSCSLRVLCALVLSCAGCSALQLNPSANARLEREPLAGAPAKYSFRVSQFLFYSDFEVPRHAPLFKELSGLREEVFRELQLPPSNTLIQVFLFEDKERYERFMQSKYPDLPKRRAFFVAQPRRLGNTEDLIVYTFWGDRIQQDLRHELTHALLHSVLKDVPLWLDEGLAEYFEVPAGSKNVNFQHLDTLRHGPTGPVRCDLERLERLSEVQQMAPAEYREAWAWTHLMLRSTPQARQILLAYLQELRTNSRPGPLKPRLAQVYLSLDDALQRHLADLDAARPSTAVGQQ